ncbi:hypothetical protein BH20ACI4_BH20ACI4_24510 [soil metagenome]
MNLMVLQSEKKSNKKHFCTDCYVDVSRFSLRCFSCQSLIPANIPFVSFLWTAVIFSVVFVFVTVYLITK